LYTSPDIIRVISKEDEMGGNVARMGESRNAYKILVGKYDLNTPSPLVETTI
jgi:hypothetical protein